MDRTKWEQKRIEEVCDKASSNIVLNKIEDNVGDYPLYGASGYVKSVDFFHMEQPYVGIVKDGAGVGRVGIYPAKSSLVGTMQYIIPKKGCMLQYLSYGLQSLHLDKHVSGATIPHIYFKNYGKDTIPFPPLSDQQAIVAELDKLNEVIALKRKQLVDLDSLAQSLFYEMFGDPVVNEKGWSLQKLETLCTHIVDCPHSTPKKTDKITQYPCIRTSELKGGNISWDTMQYLDEDEYNIRIARLKPEAGDIVFGREGTIGDAVILPTGYFFSLGQRTMLLRANETLVTNTFLHRVILSEWVKRHIRSVNVSSTVAHVNIKDFKLFNIPLPPLPLQQSFAAKVAKIEAEKQRVKASLKDLETLLASRMQYWFDN